ncbi:MAG: hypothetical protein HY318_00235 [Armatimonadetes bacterium]|nr:hypothetical protein [Armatimonadota bacterium]
MKTLLLGLITIHYSGDSQEVARRLLTVTRKSYPVFKKLFAADHDLSLDIYWADRKDWPNVPLCRHRQNYGMPHMTQGANHSHAVILPAANLDMPEALSSIVKPLLDPRQLTAAEARNLRRWLGLKSNLSDEGLLKYLSSQKFYVDYLVEIVLVHEVMHDFCFEFGIPENYGRDGRQAWWLFEGLAQWSVLWVQRSLGNDKWAGLHELLYRWMYRTGKDDKGNVSPIEYANYAWFHGALVEMFCELEECQGKKYGPEVLRHVLQSMRGREYLTDGEVVTLFSRAAGEDLSPWFRERWLPVSR